MISLEPEEFEKLVEEGIAAIPERHLSRLKNVAMVIADRPDASKRKKLGLRKEENLYGLYEGIPQIHRGESYSFVPPDTITIFREPILEVAHSPEEVKEIVKNTVWHEIAHHFGMNEDEVQEREIQEGRDHF